MLVTYDLLEVFFHRPQSLAFDANVSTGREQRRVSVGVSTRGLFRSQLWGSKS